MIKVHKKIDEGTDKEKLYTESRLNTLFIRQVIFQIIMTLNDLNHKQKKFQT